MKSLKYRPMVVVGFTALIIIFLSVVSGVIFDCGLVSLTVGTVLTALLFFTKDYSRYPVLMYVCASLIFSGIMLISGYLFGIHSAEKYYNKSCYVEGVVSSESFFGSSYESCVIEAGSINGEKVNLKINLFSKSFIDFNQGDKIRFNANLYSSSENEDTLTRLYDYAGNVYLNACIYDSSEIEIENCENDFFETGFALLRNKIKNNIYSFLPGGEGGITVAMLLGDKSGVSEKTLNSFRNSGISHLFSVSGFHLSVFSLSLYYLLKKLCRKSGISEIISIVFIFFFMALTGFTPSVCRAGLMLTVVQLGKLTDEDSDSVNSLALSVLILLAVNPMQAVSVSFLMSVCATLGIITLYGFIIRKVQPSINLISDKLLKAVAKSIISAIGISFSACVFTLPVTIIFIGRACFTAPLTNLLISYFATLQMVFGGICALLFKIRFIAYPLAFVAGIIAKYIIFVSDLISDIPYTQVYFNSDKIKIIIVFLLFLIFICLNLIPRFRQKITAVISVVLSAMIICTGVFYFENYYYSYISVKNTGEGITAFAQNRGCNMILGCGGSDYYLSYNSTDKVKKNVDLIIAPDFREYNSGCFIDLSDNCDFSAVVSGTENYDIKRFYPDYIVADNFTVNPTKETQIDFIYNNDFSFLHYKVNNTEVLIIYKCENISNIPKEYFNCDIVIVNSKICSNFNYSGFGTVVICSDKNYSEKISEKINNDSVICVSDFSDLNFRINKNGNIKVDCK